MRRFPQLYRNLHIMVIVSFLGLALTGMTLKFSYTAMGQGLSRLLGGFEAAGIIHRICALVTFTYFGSHIGDMIRAEARERQSLAASSSPVRRACCSAAATGRSSSAR